MGQGGGLAGATQSFNQSEQSRRKGEGWALLQAKQRGLGNATRQRARAKGKRARTAAGQARYKALPRQVAKAGLLLPAGRGLLGKAGLRQEGVVSKRC